MYKKKNTAYLLLIKAVVYIFFTVKGVSHVI